MLADPKLGQPHKIDILLSASFLFDIIETGKYTTDQFIFQNTKFGFIASSCNEGNLNHNFCGLVTQNEPIDDLIQRFWEIETINDRNCSLSEEAVFCEEHFKSTHKRNSEGRYIIEMAMKESPPLGESKQIAQKRLDSLVKRLDKNPHMKKLYSEFMEEYESLGHMERVFEDELPSDNYYLPHHGVYKSESSTTPLRVVFNASSPSSNGVSLNDVLLKGDVVEDIFELILRFRKHKFAFTFDVQKMFRQILVAPHQRDYLRILWVDNNTFQPITFKLNTITYGTACAPYYAIRTVKQLAMDESSDFPLASEIALCDIYMDDGITGSDDLKTAQTLQTQLIDMFAKGGMKLHKWTSNSLELLNSNPSSNQERAFPNDAHVSKTLGMDWLHLDDYFIYKVDCKNEPNPTKRNVLSVIARLYDPLGLLGPIICKMKIFLQKLWLEKLSFDDPLPHPIANEWSHLVSSLKDIELIKIPRWILVDSPQKVVLQCFSDSSEAAYGAVIYLQCIMADDTSTSRLLASKSRVSPLKTVSIPRLELCGCLLASQLKVKVEQALKLQIDNIVMYTDSTISLAWIQTSPHRLKTFVANRVSKIQQLTENCSWQHIPSDLNPADVLSRGLVLDQLAEFNLWWNGPPFLQEPVSMNFVDEQVMDTSSDSQFLCEFKDTTSRCLMTLNSSEFINNFLNISNNYRKLINVFSYLLRFIGNCRNQKKCGPLSAAEIQEGEFRLISLVQQVSLAEEFASLNNEKQVTSTSNLKFLSPFLDNAANVIRVGGRLKNSNLPFNVKHPVVLPKGHAITKLIIQDIHIRNFHVRAQTLLHLTRQNFWPIGGRNLARSIVHNCVKCSKYNPKFLVQKMGDLPEERYTPSSPFSITGVDFCGPFYIKNKFQRKGPLQKIYIAIFICFVTRAVHFEIVSDLSSDSFIAALKRFIARRGKIATIFTDNGRNFIGANNELKRLFKLVSDPNNTLAHYLGSEKIQWNFIPPKSAHFGGIWEAGVKSFKFHFLRAVGNLKLTYEEFLTVSNQIEGILNSRPLVPLSSDANDLESLSPAHFLVGRPISAIVEPNLTDLSDNVLKRWQRVTKITQYVWMRWQRDYLNHLQQKNKWYFQKDNITIGTLVIVKEDNVPLNCWLLGRIVKVFYGKDKLVRVCLVKTAKGTFKRPITKLAILPINK